MSNDKNKTLIIFLAIFFIGIVSRALLVSRDFIHMDSVLYAIGSFNFSIKEGTPHAPGYFLYIMSTRLLNLFTKSPHTSLSIISIVYSGLIASVMYYFGKVIKDNKTGLLSALFFLVSPLFWYKGICIYTYLNSGFFILLTALQAYKITVENKKNVLVWFSICFALLIGVRPQELLAVFPLYIYVLLHVKLKEAFISVLIFCATCAAWFIPLVLVSGGLTAYLEALRISSTYLGGDSILSGHLVSKIANHVERMGIFFLWAYFLGIVPMAYALGRIFDLSKLTKDKKMQLLLVWILPTIIYNVFIQFGEIGHGMSWGLGLIIVLAESVVLLSEDLAVMIKSIFKLHLKKIAYSFVIVPIVFTNLFMFFYDFDKGETMVYSFKRYRQFNHKDVVRNNRFFVPKISLIREEFNNEDILILTTSAFSYQVMFYAPRALVIQSNSIRRKKNNRLAVFSQFKPTFFKDKREFVIPKNVNRLIIFDDMLAEYFSSERSMSPIKKQPFAMYNVRPGERLVFDYHKISLE